MSKDEKVVRTSVPSRLVPAYASQFRRIPADQL